MHRVMYHALKERCLRMLVRAQHLEKVCRECGRGSQAHRRLSHAWNPPCILLVSGVRMEESTRRMGHAQAVSRDPADCARVWCAPLLTWRNTEKNVYIEQEGLPRNPVVGKLCMSGECLCGAYAAENEIREIEYWYPAVAERIHALEKQMAVLGKPAKWGTRPKRAQRPEENQADLFSLCWSCGNKPATLQEVSHAS